VEVEIAKLVSFGAFARLENGIEGLIHVSEMSTDRVQKPEDVLNVGDKVMAKVISIDPVDRKIGLSIREYERDLENELMSKHGESGAEKTVDSEGKVDVGAAVRGAVPGIQAGQSLEDVAHDLMAAVSRVESERKAAELSESQAAAAEEAAQEPPAEAPAEEAQPETPAKPAGEASTTPEAESAESSVSEEAPVVEEEAAPEAEKDQ